MKTSRRNFLVTLGMALNAVAAALLAIPIIGYLGGALKNRRRDQAWITLGKLDAFPVGQTRLATYTNPFKTPWDGETAEVPCWVRRIAADRFQVFAINCTHLGCPVRWFPESGLFMCPCHGGVYYEDGDHASGPPPRRLYEYEYKVDGEQLLVRGGQLPTLAQGV
jgi:quinol---cytochrome c reductase iron-sulfur subunit, bacillus type